MRDELDWLFPVGEGLALITVSYVLIQSGIPLGVIVLVLLGACLIACAGILSAGLRGCRRAERALGATIN